MHDLNGICGRFAQLVPVLCGQLGDETRLVRCRRFIAAPGCTDMPLSTEHTHSGPHGPTVHGPLLIGQCGRGLRRRLAPTFVHGAAVVLQAPPVQRQHLVEKLHGGREVRARCGGLLGPFPADPRKLLMQIAHGGFEPQPAPHRIAQQYDERGRRRREPDAGSNQHQEAGEKRTSSTADRKP